MKCAESRTSRLATCSPAAKGLDYRGHGSGEGSVEVSVIVHRLPASNGPEADSTARRRDRFRGLGRSPGPMPETGRIP